MLALLEGASGPHVLEGEPLNLDVNAVCAHVRDPTVARRSSSRRANPLHTSTNMKRRIFHDHLFFDLPDGRMTPAFSFQSRTVSRIFWSSRMR